MTPSAYGEMLRAKNNKKDGRSKSDQSSSRVNLNC